jgi:hypothetical protein
MPTYDFDSPVIDGSHADAGAEANAILKDHDNVRFAANWLWVKTPIVLPPYKELYASNPTNLIKGSNGPMVVMASGGFQNIRRLVFEGNSEGWFTGPNILVEAGGGWQLFDNVRTSRSADCGIDMRAPHAGHSCTFDNCELSASGGKPGVQLPTMEPTTGGLRRFFGCKAGGGLLVDWAGSNTGMMIGCDTYNFKINENGFVGIFIGNRFAIPAAEILMAGNSHRFLANITSSKVRLANNSLWYDGSNYDNGVIKTWMRMLTTTSKPTLDPVLAEGLIKRAAAERKASYARWERLKDRSPISKVGPTKKPDHKR